MITFNCFNKSCVTQIPKSSVNYDAWYLKDTSIAMLIKHGETELFIHTDNLMPLMHFIHRGKNPGSLILDEICASDEIKAMSRGVLRRSGLVVPDVFVQNDLINNAENLQIFGKLFYDMYHAEIMKGPSYGWESLKFRTLENLTIFARYDDIKYSFHIKHVHKYNTGGSVDKKWVIAILKKMRAAV